MWKNSKKYKDFLNNPNPNSGDFIWFLSNNFQIIEVISTNN